MKCRNFWTLVRSIANSSFDIFEKLTIFYICKFQILNFILFQISFPFYNMHPAKFVRISSCMNSNSSLLYISSTDFQKFGIAPASETSNINTPLCIKIQHFTVRRFWRDETQSRGQTQSCYLKVCHSVSQSLFVLLYFLRIRGKLHAIVFFFFLLNICRIFSCRTIARSRRRWRIKPDCS